MRAAGVLSPFGCAFRLVERRVEASRVSYRARRGRGVLLGLGVLDVLLPLVCAGHIPQRLVGVRRALCRILRAHGILLQPVVLHVLALLS